MFISSHLEVTLIFTNVDTVACVARVLIAIVGIVRIVINSKCIGDIIVDNRNASL